MISLSKCSKFYVDFENTTKLGKNGDGFEDNCVWLFCGSFCQLWEEYMSSAVNVIKSGPRISDPTKRHNTQFISFYIIGSWA